MTPLTGLLLSLAVLLLLPRAALAQEGSLDLGGRVINGTPGGGDVQGLVVVLQGLLPDGQEAQRWEAVAGPDGAFRFPGLVPQERRLYRAVVEYGGARYYSDGLLAEELPDAFLELAVYEPTESHEAVRFLQQSTVVVEVDREAGLLHILESTTVENAGDRTYIGLRDASGEVVTVRIPLPPLAFDVVPGLGFGSQGFLVSNGALADVAPLPPGQREMIYSYSVAYLAPQHALTRAYPYSVTTVRLLTPAGSLQVEPAGVDFTEQVQIGGQAYDSFVARDVAAGQRVGLILRHLPASLGSQSRDMASILRWAAGAATALALLGLLLYVLVRKGHQRQAETKDGAAARAEMVDRLARLEEARRAGLIAEEEYQSGRAAERQRLRELLPASPPQDLP